MSTVLKAIPSRFIRRATSGRITNTQWLGALASATDQLENAPWVRTSMQQSKLPINNPLLAAHDDEAYDAFQQSGAAEPASGEQQIWMGAAAYRIKLPDDEVLRGVAFTLAADKFATGGLNVAAVLSDSPLPPADWEQCFFGGVGNAVDTSGKFTIPPVEYPEGTGIYNGALATTENLVSREQNKTGIFVLDLSGEVGSYGYLYLIISLYAPGRWRREYYVEGSGMLLPDSIYLTFEGDDVEMPTDIYTPVRLPLRLAKAPVIYDFKQEPRNLADTYLRTHWAMRQLTGGLLADSKTTEGKDSLTDNLSAFVRVDALDVVARGTLAECMCAEPVLRGTSAWFRAWEAPEGSSPIRISLFDTQPDPASPTAFAGLGGGCIGSAVFADFAGDDYLEVPIRRDARSGRLWVTVAVADVALDDRLLEYIGCTPYGGVDMRDAHVASVRIPIAPASAGWLFFGEPGGMILPYIDMGDGFGDARKYAVGQTGSAAIVGTSEGPWRDWSTGEPAALSASAVMACKGDFFVAADGGKLYYAGDTAGMDMSGGLPAGVLVDVAVFSDGFVGVDETGNAMAYGSQVISQHGSDVLGWASIARIKAFGSVNRSRIIGITDTGGLVASGWPGGTQTVFAGLAAVADVHISGTAAAFLFTDGTTRVFRLNTVGEIQEEYHSAAWTGIISLALTTDAIVGVSSSNELKVFNITSANRFADIGVPPGTKAMHVLGYPTARPRLAIYYEVIE